MFGYAGKILHVDLTNGTIEVEEPPEELYRTYLGGSALGMYYLLKNTPAGADPLGPDNTMAFMFETRFPQHLTRFAAELETLQDSYIECWDGLDKRFDGKP